MQVNNLATKGGLSEARLAEQMSLKHLKKGGYTELWRFLSRGTKTNEMQFALMGEGLHNFVIDSLNEKFILDSKNNATYHYCSSCHEIIQYPKYLGNHNHDLKDVTLTNLGQLAAFKGEEALTFFMRQCANHPAAYTKNAEWLVPLPFINKSKAIVTRNQTQLKAEVIEDVVLEEQLDLIQKKKQEIACQRAFNVVK